MRGTPTNERSAGGAVTTLNACVRPLIRVVAVQAWNTARPLCLVRTVLMNLLTAVCRFRSFVSGLLLGFVTFSIVVLAVSHSVLQPLRVGVHLPEPLRKQ